MLLQLAIKLHVGINFLDLFRGETAAMVNHLDQEIAGTARREHFNTLARFRELERVLNQFPDDPFEMRRIDPMINIGKLLA